MQNAKLALVVMVVLACLASTSQASTGEELFEGWVEGLVSSELPGVPDMSSCKREVGAVESDFSSAFRNFGVSRTSNLNQGLRDLSSGMNDFLEALRACGATDLASKVAGAIASMGAGYGEISEAIKIMVNGIDIYDDISSAHSDWSRGDAYGCGEELGKLTATLI